MLALRKPEPDDDERQRQPERVERRTALPAIAFDAHQEVADHQQDRAEEHRLALAQVLVGQVAADHGRDVDQRGVGAVDHRRVAIGEQPVLGQVQHQQRAHAVVGEALPHLGEEQHVQAARVAQEGLVFRGNGTGCGTHAGGTPGGRGRPGWCGGWRWCACPGAAPSGKTTARCNRSATPASNRRRTVAMQHAGWRVEREAAARGRPHLRIDPRCRGFRQRA